jgi:hypothetical protein
MLRKQGRAKRTGVNSSTDLDEDVFSLSVRPSEGVATEAAHLSPTDGGCIVGLSKQKGRRKVKEP